MKHRAASLRQTLWVETFRA